MQRKPDPDRQTMEIARVLEPHLEQIVSQRIRTLQGLIEHAISPDMDVTIRCVQYELDGPSWYVYIHKDGQSLRSHEGPLGHVGSLEHALKVIPELVGDIKKGRRRLE